MDTNELVRSLAADHGWRAWPVGRVLAVALLIALPFTAAMFVAYLGVRADVVSATANPFFVLKFIVTLALVFAAVTFAAQLVRPGAQAKAWVLAVPLALLAGGIGADLMLPQTSSWAQRLIGTNALVCLTAIPALSLPLLVAALIGLKHGATMQPGLTGAVAGLIAGGLAATFYAAHCVDDSPLFVATWYSLALVVVTLAGALAGRWVLRL